MNNDSKLLNSLAKPPERSRISFNEPEAKQLSSSNQSRLEPRSIQFAQKPGHVVSAHQTTPTLLNSLSQPKSLNQHVSVTEEPENLNNFPMSEECRNALLFKYTRMPVLDYADYFKKLSGLMMCGMSKREAKKLCKPKKVSEAERKRLFDEYMKEQQRELKIYNRRRKKELEEARLVELRRGL
jgi:hypothetical protein